MPNPSLFDYTGAPPFEVTLAHHTLPKMPLLDSLFLSPNFHYILSECLLSKGHYQPSTAFPRCTTFLSIYSPCASISTASQPKFRPAMTMSLAWLSLHHSCHVSIGSWSHSLQQLPLSLHSTQFSWWGKARRWHQNHSLQQPRITPVWGSPPRLPLRPTYPQPLTPTDAWNVVYLNIIKHHRAFLLLTVYLSYWTGTSSPSS